MAIKNLMKDVVTAIVDEVLAKELKENSDTELYKEDIITYILNKIPPRYYTSSRGILHGKIESQFVFQQKTDILLLSHEAIKTIKSRRKSELSLENFEPNNNNYYFPHIIGEVLEETTFSIIPDVEVNLYHNDMLMEMIDPSWRNPFTTNKATESFFHFWPQLSLDENDKKITVTLGFNHPKFNKKKLTFDLEIVEKQCSYKSHIIPMILLQKLEGADVSSL